MQRVGEALAGAYVRQLPGLVSVGAPVFSDDREANQIEFRMSFEHPTLGRYERGVLELEVSAMEIADLLTVPPEANRRTPFALLQQPQRVEHRLSVTGPRVITGGAPPQQQVGDKHFSLQQRVELSGSTVSFVTQFERRSDEVLVADMALFRERIGTARMRTGNRLRLSLLDIKALEPQFPAIDKRLNKYRGLRPDALMR